MESETPEQRRERRKLEAEERREMKRLYLRTSVSAMEIPLSVLVGFFMGRYVDNHFDTAPWGMWTGFVFGMLTAGRFIYRLIERQKREYPDDPAEASGPTDPDESSRTGFHS